MIMEVPNIIEQSGNIHKGLFNERLCPLERIKALKSYWKKEFMVKNRIKLKVNNRTTWNKNRIDNVIAFDTETHKGVCRLLCSSDLLNTKGKYLYMKGIPRANRFEACLNFLIQYGNKKKYNYSWFFFWNIDFDISSILKHWNNIKAIRKLYKGMEVNYKEFKLSWIKGRIFILKKGKKVVRFTDLNNLFKSKLQKASLKYLENESKDDIDGSMLNNSLTYWNRNIDDIIKYCIQDCILTQKLGIILLITLIKAKVSLPKYLVSPASLSKADFRYNCYIPNINHIPKKIIDIGYDTYFGGRFEIIKRGTIPEGYLYDINSQYPKMIMELPSLKYGVWLPYLSEYLEYEPKLTSKTIPKEQCIGYFKAKVHIPDDNYLSTIPIRHKGIVKFCNGYFEKWFTWYDLDLMRDYIVEITEGYIYKESPFEYYPFLDRILFHYRRKAESKNLNELMYAVYKLTMNALYGCFIEVHKNELDDGSFEYDAGLLFNPIYASQITAFGRWSVVKDVWNERESILAIHTDSILMDKEIKLDIGKEIGQWSKEASGKAYILNTGMYQINGKKNKIATRGIPKKFIRNWFWFAGWYNELNIKEFKVKRMLKIGQSLVQYNNILGVNIMYDNIKSVNLNSDKKRCWNRNFIDFKDSLNNNIESLPYIAVLDNTGLIMFPNPLVYY